MRQRIPIIYLVDSAGVNLPYQGGVFPGQYGAARIFYYNSIMRRYLHVPQISAVMGSCIAGGAYLPALSDVIFMVDGTSFMGLGGPNLVKGATGQTVDAETLGGARTHTARERRGPLPGRRPTPSASLRIREYVARLPAPRRRAPPGARRAAAERPPAELYDLLPARPPACPTTCTQLLDCLLDDGALDEFQPDVAREMICGHAHIEGWPVAVIANRARAGQGPGRADRPRFGGIVYTESAEKVAYFIETASRERIPLLFVQDVSGFMVGPEAEHSGIIRAGARFVEAMATAVVPKIVLTVNHASGAGYYAMAGQGFDPDFILSLAHRPDGGHGGRVGGRRRCTGPTSRRRGRPAPNPRRRCRPRWTRCAPTTSTSSTPSTPRPAATSTRIVTPEETRDQLAFLLRSRVQLRRPAPRSLRPSSARHGHPTLMRRLPLRGCSGPPSSAAPPRRSLPSRTSTRPRLPHRQRRSRRRPATEAPRRSRSRCAPPERRASRAGWMPLAADRRRRVPHAASRPTTAAACSSAFSTAGSTPACRASQRPPTGDPKILDLRDFSGEGAVALAPRRRPRATRSASRADRAARHEPRPDPQRRRRAGYGGVLRERPLGEHARLRPQRRRRRRRLPCRCSWRRPAMAGCSSPTPTATAPSRTRRRSTTTSAARETFGWAQPRHAVPDHHRRELSGRRRAADARSLLRHQRPRHPTSPASPRGTTSTASAGFDGVAPGAQLLGLKIANDAHGGDHRHRQHARARSTTPSASPQERRQLPLVLNMSFGVGNELEGTGADRRSSSTRCSPPIPTWSSPSAPATTGRASRPWGFPARRARALTVGATFPGIFLAGAPATGGDPGGLLLAPAAANSPSPTS